MLQPLTLPRPAVPPSVSPATRWMPSAPHRAPPAALARSDSEKTTRFGSHGAADTSPSVQLPLVLSSETFPSRRLSNKWQWRPSTLRNIDDHSCSALQIRCICSFCYITSQNWPNKAIAFQIRLQISHTANNKAFRGAVTSVTVLISSLSFGKILSICRTTNRF